MDKIAVQLHLFYVDLLDEFLWYFNNIPCVFDVYISCPKGIATGPICKKARKELPLAEKVVVRNCPNRGRDMAPFYVTFGRELQQYDYILHVHSKKSKHLQEGGGDWRKYSLDSLVGCEELVEEILNDFRENADLGLVYPDWHPDIPMIGYTWMANGAQGKALLESMGFPFEEGLFHYPTGSFFWARTDAIRPLLSRGFRYRDFPKERGQIDGTLAHVLERAIAFVAKGQGYHSDMIDIREKCIRTDRSTKPFRAYFKLSLKEAKEKLRAYDSVSFGVFGTLVSVAVVSRADLYRLAASDAGLGEEIARRRVEAEEQGKSRCKSGLTLDAIYEELTSRAGLTEQDAERMKACELQALRQRTIPRQDMLDLYRFLIQEGKKVSIVCDSCYPQVVIENLLIGCGFIGYDKIWVSSQWGAGKCDGQLWNLVYHRYDSAHHIHVGSDVYGDWYTLEARGQKSMYVMSSSQVYRYLGYEEDAKEGELSLEESLKLGMQIHGEWFNSPFSLVRNEKAKQRL